MSEWACGRLLVLKRTFGCCCLLLLFGPMMPFVYE